MTDKPDSDALPEDKKPPVSDKTAEDEAHQAKMDELFGDLDDEETAETPESIKAERDELRQKLADMAGRLGASQQDVLSLTKKLATQKEESESALARTRREVDEQKDFALAKFVKEFASILDTVELGLNAVSKKDREADPKLDKAIAGFEKVLGPQLTAIFNKFGVKVIDPKGEAFDPEKHEAISAQDDGDPKVESDTVVAVAQKGYELNGRVIRSAKVIVKP